MICFTYLKFYVFVGLLLVLSQLITDKEGLIITRFRDWLVMFFLWPIVLVIMLVKIRGVK